MKTKQVREKINGEIHKNYCENCPSKPGMPKDPEAKDIESLPDGIRQRYVFYCGWRSYKLCKGICEQLNYIKEKHENMIGVGT